MYHINRNGEIAICKATKKACPLGGAHGTREELEQVLAETYTTDSILTKTSKKYELPPSEGLPELNSLDLHYWTVVDATLGVFVHKGHPFVRSDSTKSQYYCLECNTRLPKSDEYTKVQWSVNCPNCGRECIDNLVGTTLLKSSEKFFHKDAVREEVWYHYTEKRSGSHTSRPTTLRHGSCTSAHAKRPWIESSPPVTAEGDSTKSASSLQPKSQTKYSKTIRSTTTWLR